MTLHLIKSDVTPTPANRCIPGEGSPRAREFGHRLDESPPVRKSAGVGVRSAFDVIDGAILHAVESGDVMALSLLIGLEVPGVLGGP